MVGKGKRSDMSLRDRVKIKSDLVIIIDANGMAHMVKHALGGLSHGDQYTGIIFGFLGQLLYLKKRFRPSTMIFAWDSRKSYRKLIYPEYKAKRQEKTQEEKEFDNLAFEQFNQLRTKILPLMGFKNNFMVTGYEADDIIALVVDNMMCDGIVVSSDKDLYQLLKFGISLYDIRKKQRYGYDDFVKEYGITPSQWVSIKSIAGCSSDNIEGIRGIGEMTAIKYMKGENISERLVNDIKSKHEIIERNRRLISLPFDGIKDLGYVSLFDKINRKAFENICDEYGFESFTRNLQEWVDVFGMQ